jgi:hypothetical protein
MELGGQGQSPPTLLSYPESIVEDPDLAPGPVWTGAENITYTGFRTPDPPGRSKSLYRLIHPSPWRYNYVKNLRISGRKKKWQTGKGLKGARYVASHHSAAERGASTRILHLTPFLASVLISAQLLLTHLTCSSTVLRHVFFSPPLPLLPLGFHSRACLVMTSGGFRSVRPSHPHLRFVISKSILGCFVRFFLILPPAQYWVRSTDH